jgi:hypothetical protein
MDEIAIFTAALTGLAATGAASATISALRKFFSRKEEEHHIVVEVDGRRIEIQSTIDKHEIEEVIERALGESGGYSPST